MQVLVYCQNLLQSHAVCVCVCVCERERERERERDHMRAHTCVSGYGMQGAGDHM